MSLFFTNIKRNMKAALKTVKSNFKEYLCFLMAFIMVHTLFGVLTVSFQNNKTIEREALKEKGYTYHLQLQNISIEGMNALQDKEHTEKFYTFEISKNGRIEVTFLKNPLKSQRRFQKDVYPYLGEATAVEYSPLYQYEQSSIGKTSSFLFVLGMFTLLSFLLLTALFKIRINHFKFTYSIYLTFGGRFKKLLVSSLCEIFYIYLLGFLPGLLLTNLVGMLLYLPFGEPFRFYFSPIPVMLFLPLLASVLALILPIKFLASSTPVKLMKAEDNSNLVSSPRKSKIFLKKNIVYTELVGLWRFRKYIASLLLSTVSFAVLLNVGGYIAGVYSVYADENVPEFSVDLRFAEDVPLFLDAFEKEAKDRNMAPYLTEKTVGEQKAGGQQDEVLPHLAIPGKSVTGIGFVPCPYNENFSATASLTILPFDKDALDCLEKVHHYEYIGDPSKLLTSDSYVIVSSSLANSESNSLQPGDTVYVPTDAMRRSDVTTKEDLSNFETDLQNYVYTYRAFTVAAVITNYADYSNMLLYLPTLKEEGASSAYGEVMGKEPQFNRVHIHLSTEEDASTAEKILTMVLGPLDRYTNNIGKSSRDIEKAKNYPALILTISFLVFLVSPIAGFYAQSTFYKKRHLELDVLRAVGARKKHLNSLFAVDISVFAVLSGLLYSLGTFLAVQILCLLLNTPFFTMLLGKADYAYKFEPKISLPLFFTGLGLTLLFSVLEILYSKHQYTKAQSDHIAADFTANEENIG